MSKPVHFSRNGKETACGFNVFFCYTADWDEVTCGRCRSSRRARRASGGSNGKP